MNTKTNRSFFQFSKPELTESIFAVNPSFSSDEPLRQEIKIESKVSKPQKRKDESFATVTLTVRNFDEFKLTDDTPYLLRVSMESDFTWKKELDENEEYNLLRVNGSSFLLSYIRPFVSEMTGMSKFKREEIPFIDFTSSKEVEKTE